MTAGPPLPTGTVTFLFTDIEGSTLLLRQSGDRYPELLEDHRRLLRAVIADHDGREVDTAGDSFFVAFANAGQAVAASVAAQRRLGGQPWPDGWAVRVRMGLHTGEATVSAAGYVGIDVHRAARIAGAAHGGQVVLSETTHALVRDALPPGTTLRDLGEHRLKDLARPERLYQVVIPGLADAFPELRSVASTPDALPTRLDSFVGRAQEIAAVVELLEDDAVRLVTLTGPGGIGKSRLAVEVAAKVVHRFEDGVSLVLLAGVPGPSAVVPAIGEALRLPDAPGRSTSEVLADYLRHRHQLLVLDNFEQVVDAAPVVSALLAATERLKVLVTSREVLRVAGEHEFDVPPLSVPAGDDQPAEALEDCDAVRLFVDRARAVQPGFEPTDDTMRAIVEICRRLDGLPLAIELAAARVRVLAPAAMLAKLGRRLDLLVGGRRDLPERQRALRNTIEWSYGLLDDSDRRLFERLGVFAGGWTLDGAHAVAGGDGVEDVLGGLSSLVDKSLVRHREIGGDSRFTMLETVRELALEHLEEGGDGDRRRQRHAEFFVELAVRAGQRLRSRDEDRLLATLRAENDNLRAAIRWCLDHGEPGRVAQAGWALWPFWWVQSRQGEGVAWMDEALARPEALTAEERGQAEVALGILSFGRGDYGRAYPVLAGCHERCREVGNDFGAAMALALVGVMAAVAGNVEAGRDAVRRSLQTFEAIDDTWGVAFAQYILGRVLILEGRHDEAVAVTERSVAGVRPVGERYLLGMALLNLGWARIGTGEAPAAEGALQESLEIMSGFRNFEGRARSLEALAAVAVAAGEHRRAALLFGAAEGARRSIGADLWLPDKTSHDRTAEALRAALGQAELAARLAEGAALPAEQALEVASGR